MSFAAPAAEAVAARAGAGAATARAGSAAGKAAASVPAGTAQQRAQALIDSGTSRTRARRQLRDEYGATVAEADDLLDGTTAPAPVNEPPASTPDTPASRAGATIGGRTGRAVGGAMNAGGGAILGVLLYVLGLVYLRGGSAGLHQWYRAKFLNDTGTVAPSATAATPGVGNNGSGLSTPQAGGIGQAGGGLSSSGGGVW